MAVINSGIGSALLKFTFSDAEGDVIASFRMNPADVKLANRCKEVSEYFENLRDNAPDDASLEDVVKFNDELEDKICYLLGYDAKDALFGLVSATTICEDGEFFAVKIMNKITEAVEPEMQKRKAAMTAAVAKHTAKYEK